MADLLDKAVLIGLGLEKKAKEMFEELEKTGQAGKAAAGAEAPAGLSAKQQAENKLVEEGIRILKEMLSTIKGGKEKLDRELIASAEKILTRLHVPTESELDVIKEMARVSREKVDKLEKIVQELETRLGK
ncbi:MAG: hypothetical protein HY884_05840 [Deltaproteobacteria bacterium]|nr:hypothetical protein [Deltaproteobacteria bacterium]